MESGSRWGAENCPLSIATIIGYVLLVLLSALLSVLPLGVYMAKQKYEKMKDIGVELPEGLRNQHWNPQLFSWHNDENVSDEHDESESNLSAKNQIETLSFRKQQDGVADEFEVASTSSLSVIPNAATIGYTTIEAATVPKTERFKSSLCCL